MYRHSPLLAHSYLSVSPSLQPHQGRPSAGLQGHWSWPWTASPSQRRKAPLLWQEWLGSGWTPGTDSCERKTTNAWLIGIGQTGTHVQFLLLLYIIHCPFFLSLMSCFIATQPPPPHSQGIVKFSYLICILRSWRQRICTANRLTQTNHTMTSVFMQVHILFKSIGDLIHPNSSQEWSQFARIKSSKHLNVPYWNSKRTKNMATLVQKCLNCNWS